MFTIEEVYENVALVSPSAEDLGISQITWKLSALSGAYYAMVVELPLTPEALQLRLAYLMELSRLTIQLQEEA